jgi:hypothetical protein
VITLRKLGREDKANATREVVSAAGYRDDDEIEMA